MPYKIPNILVPDSVYRIPRNYSGTVVVSDVDRTYLDTQIHSIGGLLRAAFERPERKHGVPGFSLLLRALRRGAEELPSKNPLFFVSASPPQIGPTLRAKMDLDGIEHEGLILKDQLKHVRSGEFKKLKEQLGYKLGALLSLWYFLPKTSKLIFFGDDSESDARVFTLFALISSGKLNGKELYFFLLDLGVFRQEAIQVAWLSRHFEKVPSKALLAAFINLDLNLSPASYGRLAPFFFPTENSLQAAAVAYENKMIRMRAVVSVGREFLLLHDWSPEQIAKALIEGCRRFLYSKTTLIEISGALLGADVFKVGLENTKIFNSISTTSKGFLPRQWGADTERRTLQEWKKLLLVQSV
ncbi:MAG: phosphatase domain-containing protein [Bdellovibrionota bacterium]